MRKLLTFADYNNDMKSKDGFEAFTSSTKKNSSQTIGDLNCFMTGNELNYAFQQTVSSKYTFGSGDKLIDSFPSWPEMKKKVFFNPYSKVSVFYYVGDDFKPDGNIRFLTHNGYEVSFGNKGDYVTITMGIHMMNAPIVENSSFYYNDETYNISNISFKLTIIYGNVGTLCDTELTWDDFKNIKENTYMAYRQIKWRCDGSKHKLYYSPKNYMTLHTSEGNVTLNNSASQLYTYI